MLLDVRLKRAYLSRKSGVTGVPEEGVEPTITVE